MMKSVLLFVLLLVNALAFTEFEYQSAFTFWMQQYQKSYSHDEFQHRYKIFRQNMDFIEQNNKANKGYTVAMNQFGDLSSSEFANLYLGTRVKVPSVPVVPVSSRVRAPVSWDWEPREQLLPLKTKDNAVLAGLSLPLDQLKVATSLLLEAWFLSLNKT
jgi:hypothetical protein